jgi:hypothetical protein
LISEVAPRGLDGGQVCRGRPAIIGSILGAALRDKIFGVVELGRLRPSGAGGTPET